MTALTGSQSGGSTLSQRVGEKTGEAIEPSPDLTLTPRAVPQLARSLQQTSKAGAGSSLSSCPRALLRCRSHARPVGRLYRPSDQRAAPPAAAASPPLCSPNARTFIRGVGDRSRQEASSAPTCKPFGAHP